MKVTYSDSVVVASVRLSEVAGVGREREKMVKRPEQCFDVHVLKYVPR
jgi:hypothetical protein